MSETPAKARLVRCPKCDNLLHEVADYSVYQCGGCGAVLRARNNLHESGTHSEKSDEESDGAVLNKKSKESSNFEFSKRKSSINSENHLKSNGSSGRKSEVEDSTMEMNKNIEEINNLKITQEIEDSKQQLRHHESNSRRSIRSSNRRIEENGFRASQMIDSNEGPSNYHEYAELEVEDDRAELLRKLDELKDQIVRSRPLNDKSKEKVVKNHYVEPHSFANLHRNHRSSGQVQAFNDPFMLRRAPIQTPIMNFEQNPYNNPYFHGQFHHPSCSCLICYNHRHAPQPPPPMPPIAPPVLANDPVYYHRDYVPFMGVHNAKPQTRWSNDLHRPPRVVLTAGGRRCRPVGGGSPFVACCNCFELLQIPTGKAQKKLRCSNCSEVILLSVVNKRLVLSILSIPMETNRNSKKEMNDHKNNAKWASMEFSSEDYENSRNYDFQSMDRLPLEGQSLTSHKSALSTSSYTSEDRDISITQEEAKKQSPPPTGSPLQDHFDYSTKYNRGGAGNESQRSEMEKVKALRQNSMKDTAVATEMEILSNEYSNITGTSQESGEVDRPVSFFAGIIKKSFREFSRSSQNVDQGKVNVTVNGHPIPERLVKKAEKLAGAIQPGDYWYDSRAGFWGIMGGPCRGIIPPFIEEFNYPMPENCADGKTNVFVNGRELHQKDLDLLASRGLPTDADRSYVVEISGRVLDEDSGMELQSLGKLAPTVESKKHGFGMKPPRPAAAN